MADGLAIKHAADLRQAANAGPMDCPASYRGLSESEVLGIGAAMDAFLDERSNIAPHLYDDALPCLEFFRSLGVRMGVVTNGNANLSGFGGGVYFGDLCVTSGDSGAVKPSPVPFVAASQQADAPPGRVLFIGDALDKDVAGANACGMVSCWLNREAHRGVFCAADPGPGGAPHITVGSLQPDEVVGQLLAYLDQKRDRET